MAKTEKHPVLMEAELVGTFEPDSPEWHEARGAGVGSSEIAILVGLSDWSSPYKLWHEKAGLLEADFEENEAMEWGKRLEEPIAQKYADKHNEGYRVRTTGSWRNVDRLWQLCNPDRLVFGAKGLDLDHLLEIKAPGSSTAWEWEDGVPPKYRAQVIWQQDVFGIEKARVATLIGGNRYMEFDVEYDPFTAESYRQVALDFMQSIDDGNPPPIDGSQHTYRTIRRLNPSLERGTDVQLEDEAQALVAKNWLEAVNTAKAAESAQLKWGGHMLAMMGTAQYAYFDGQKIASRVAVKDSVPYLKVQ